MNKTKFLELVKNPDRIEEKDLTKLDELISDHPYSQIIHILSVKGRKVFNKPEFEKSLNLAATYAYDRGLLRSIIDGNELPADALLSVPEEPVEEVQDKELEETSDFSWINNNEDEDDIFIDNASETTAPTKETTTPSADLNDDIIQEYEMETSDEPMKPDSGIDEVKTDSPEDKNDQTILETTSQSEEPDQLKTENITDSEDFGIDESIAKPKTETKSEEANTETSANIDKTTDSESTDSSVREEIEPPDSVEEDKTQATSAKKSKKKDKKDKTPKPASDHTQGQEEPESSLDQELEAEAASDGIHAELMKNLHQLQESKQNFDETPDSNGAQEHQLEQIEIIDNFIKNSPVLSKPNLSAESEVISQDDLSRRSTKIDNNMVSENLAKIYMKQGKRKDAEKIYKKLMVKFPQKKGYFADQIQKLKKK